MDSNTTLQQLRDTMSKYQQYVPTNVTDITRQFMGNVGNMAPQYNELAQQQAKTYALPANLMNQYSQEKPDTGMGASARLSDIMNQIGQQQGITGSMSNSIDAAKGRIGDYAKSAYDQYLAAQQQLMNQINTQSNIYGTQKGAEAQIQAANIGVGPQMQRLKYLQQIMDLLKNQGGGSAGTLNPSQQAQWNIQNAMNQRNNAINGGGTNYSYNDLMSLLQSALGQ